MRKHVDALLIINNENLIELYEDYNFFNAFSKADDTPGQRRTEYLGK